MLSYKCVMSSLYSSAYCHCLENFLRETENSGCFYHRLSLFFLNKFIVVI